MSFHDLIFGLGTGLCFSSFWKIGVFLIIIALLDSFIDVNRIREKKKKRRKKE